MTGDGCFRLLFVSDTTIGGSGRSQRELARQLVLSGHEVEFLVDDDKPSPVTRWCAEQLADLAVRWAGRPGRRSVEWLAARPGRRVRRSHVDGLAYAATEVPYNALRGEIVRFRPDAVVVNSVERHSWRRIHRTTAPSAALLFAYVREIDSLEHFSLGERPDVLVANAESLRAALRSRDLDCHFIPSVIDVGVTAVETTRKAALAINPIASKGVDFVWKLAAAVPEIPIVVQEAWPLATADIAKIEQRVVSLPNVEFRRSVPPGPAIYGDARVLLVPYRVDSRPRVIAEAQANGIPVLAADVSALAEAIGAGGIVLPVDDVERWATALRMCWTDQDLYDSLAQDAAEHAERPEIDPAVVAAQFSRLVREALTSHVA